MNSAIQNLMDEHRLIEQVLGALETFSERLGVGETLDRASVAKFGDFFKNFADRIHHGKEEDRLFTMMEQNGFPKEYGPLAVMYEEHVAGRACVKALVEAGEGDGPLSATEREAVLAAAGAYIPLLRGHILKEDNILYPMAIEAIRNEEMDRLGEAFAAFERSVSDAWTPATYKALAAGLIAAYPPDPVKMAAASACSGCAGHM